MPSVDEDGYYWVQQEDSEVPEIGKWSGYYWWLFDREDHAYTEVTKVLCRINFPIDPQPKTP